MSTAKKKALLQATTSLRVLDGDPDYDQMSMEEADRIIAEERKKLGEDKGHLPYFGLDPAVYDALVNGKLLTLTWMDKPLMDAQGWDFLCRGIRLSPQISICNFSGTKLTLPLFRTLCQALEFLRGLIALDLSDTGLDDAQAELLSNVLRIRNQVEHLQLPFNRIGPQGMFHLSRSIAMLNALRTLDLSYNPITDDGLRCLRRSFDVMAMYGELEEGVPRQPPIERLYLNATRLEPKIAGPILIDMIETMPSLTKLHAPGNDFHTAEEAYYLTEKARAENVEIDIYLAASGWQGESDKSAYTPPPLTPAMLKWLDDKEPDADDA